MLECWKEGHNGLRYIREIIFRERVPTRADSSASSRPCVFKSKNRRAAENRARAGAGARARSRRLRCEGIPKRIPRPFDIVFNLYH